MLKPFDNKVFNFKLLLYKLSDEYDFYLAQTNGRRVINNSEKINVRELLAKIEEKELAETPILLKIKKGKYDRSFEEYALFMAYTRDALPIGILKQGLGIKVLGLVILI